MGSAITASVVPSTSVLTAGQSLSETLNWPVFLDLSNYATSAAGASIASVVVDYAGSTSGAAEPLADGGLNFFEVTVADSLGNQRSFITIPRPVGAVPPAVIGALADQNLTQATGIETFDTASAFSGTGLDFAVSALPGVAIDSATGVISFDTDMLAGQDSTTIEVTVSNSGGTASAYFALSVAPAVAYATAISGSVVNPTHGDTAQVGVLLTGSIANLLGSETILHRWLADDVVISGATGASYTPVAGDDLAVLRYAPLVDGTQVTSPSYTVRHAPPVAGSLAPVNEVQGNGAPVVNLAAGFTGQALVYADAVSWTTITGSTLTIDDAQRSETLTITAANSGGQAQVDLSVTISAFVQTGLVLTIETTSPGEVFTLPFANTGSYNGTIDMGDGAGPQVYSAWNDPAFSATYATPGTHTITMNGTAAHLFFQSNSASAAKVRTVENFGVMGWASMQESFFNCVNMVRFTAGNTDTSGCANWFGTWKNCNGMTTCDIAGMDFSSANNMSQMWTDCPSLQEPFDFTVLTATAAPLLMDEMFFSQPIGPDLPNLDPSGLDISRLQDNGFFGGGLFNFLEGRSLSTAIYDQLLINWAAQLPTPDPFDLEANEGFISDFQSSQPTMGGAVEAARRALIDAGFFLEDAASAAPEQMAAPALSMDSETQITMTRSARPFAGGLPIRYYDYRYSTDETNWTLVSGALDDQWTSKVLTGLTADTQYYVQIRARAPVTGGGVWSASATGTTLAGPQPFAVTRQGSDLVLTDVPDISAQSFTAEVQGADLVIRLSAPIVTPAPTQVAVIHADNHDGTDPDAGSYDVQIFDLGAAVGETYTLSGAGVSVGAMVVLLDPQGDVVGGGASEFERVVFVGASIMVQTFGFGLTNRIAAAEAAFEAQGAQVEVYAHAANGFDTGQVQTLLSEAMAAFPEKTLFFVHAGGNNVSRDRPYPGGQAVLQTELNGLIDIAATRPGSVVISDMTFRDYWDSTATNEAAGSKPYNDGVYLPTFQARADDLLTRAYYADGTPVSCLYEWTYENRESYLSGDNVHPSNPGGRNLLRGWLAQRLAPLCLGLPAPAQFARTPTGYQFTDNQNGTVTFAAAGTLPPVAFTDNQDGTVRRTS